jgi:large subunit ribosomal protein L15
VNLAELENMFDAGASVTPEALLELGLIRKSALKSVVILGQGELKKSLTVNAHRFSKSAKQKIEAAGGKAEIIAVAPVE